ncbi:MAG: hypothetical protein COY38_02040, partial [Candidatus Aenigmarchaeota archaeon CG_4_10_14_0_8_um_filter_37_24]
VPDGAIAVTVSFTHSQTFPTISYTPSDDTHPVLFIARHARLLAADAFREQAELVLQLYGLAERSAGRFHTMPFRLAA